MVRRIFLLFVLVDLSVGLCGQVGGAKPLVDTGVFDHWASLEGWPGVSYDGNYVQYQVKDLPRGSDVLMVQSSFGNWQRALPGVARGTFCGAGRWLLYDVNTDSLCLLGLGREERIYISNVQSYSILGDGEKRWLAYITGLSGGPEKLVLRDLNGGGERSWGDVKQCWFSPDGKGLLWEEVQGSDSLGVHGLHWLTLSGGKERLVWQGKAGERTGLVLFGPMGKALVWETVLGNAEAQGLHWKELTGKDAAKDKVIWEGKGVGACSFDQAGSQLAFITPGGAGQQGNVLWYYGGGLPRAVERAKGGDPGIDSGMVIADDQPGFSQDGERIFFKLRLTPVPKPAATGVPVTVWSYKDEPLQSVQNYYAGINKYYMAVVGIKSGAVIQLERANMQLTVSVGKSNQYVVVDSSSGGSEQWWRPSERSTVYLVRTTDGTRTKLKDNIAYYYRGNYSFYFRLSPGERYVVHYDPVERNYFSYEIATGIERNLTKGLGVSWKSSTNDLLDPYLGTPVGIVGMLSRDEGMLVYDNYDIWLLDLSGKRPPENITGGYGEAHHLRFRLEEPGETDALAGNIGAHASLLLSAFDTQTKQSGFYRKVLGTSGAPEQLSMVACKSSGLMKAAGARVWLVQRMRAEASPNYYVTRDFKTFHAVSDVHPEREYNWLTAELVNWQLPSGQWSQGILYKPENFDPHKKYPLLLNYYELKSDNLYEYHAAEATGENVNIPYFVSRGYLVFQPDIHYRMDYTGGSAREAIESAARYLSKEPWVDSTRMGLDGHSFGGYETNYVVTHSHLFAAAVEASGVSDFISDYGFIAVQRESNNSMFETNQYRIRGTLWEKPERYLANSPVLQADQVTTPLLMMHNKADGQVPYAQGLELFMALRRLGKRAWMLEYDKEGHGVEGKNALDYTIRVEQFFNHYLKGALPPKWMTEGIPAARKGIDMGYELDSSGKIQ